MVDGVDVYAYFNNDYEAAAVRDGACLRELLANPLPVRPAR